MEPKYDSLLYLQEPEPAVSTRHPSPVFTELAPSMLVHQLTRLPLARAVRGSTFAPETRCYDCGFRGFDQYLDST